MGVSGPLVGAGVVVALGKGVLVAVGWSTDEHPASTRIIAASANNIAAEGFWAGKCASPVRDMASPGTPIRSAERPLE
ncbi:hypothetical protein NN4_02440 [Nocardia ninae NBRC 108245]|uniref:Uncharacterized protein n=1 Tax=Nocardia ninae NBRC 108245 TaxID=1210091 RepID=A0A511M533_9NOCA|nr:hypothetical protein NN4_02440 [Nocardia ninae NBRC 108245]